MNVVVGSIFRDSAAYVGRYFMQIAALDRLLSERGDAVRVITVEGDSSDDTWARLQRMTEAPRAKVPLTCIKREHGGPKWGSVDVADRWKALSWCCNGVMEAIQDSDDALVYVESDLLWDPTTMRALLDHLRTVPAVASMCFTRAGHFYDTWGHRKGGIPFGPFPPYHPGLAPEGLTEIDSAGSCIVMRGSVARVARFGPDDCVLGLGRSIREQGFALYVDPQLRVVHP